MPGRASKLLMMLAVILIVGCGVGSPTSAPANTKPTELRIGMALMPKGPNLDPAQTAFSNPEFINLYDGLTELTNDGKVMPALATEWKNLDPNTWEFKLRTGVTFHNGEPFTAEAVKFSLDRIRDDALKSPMVPYFNLIREIQVVDDTTVRIMTSEPYAPLPSRMQQLYIVPPKAVQQMGAEAFNAKPIGTGPYKFSEWVKGERLTLEANESYWKGAAPVKKLTFVSAPEGSTRVAKLLNNEVDIIELVLDADIPRLKADANIQVLEVESTWTNWISIPSFTKPFDDVRVRQALNYAVDVDSIIAKVMGGHAHRVSIANAHKNFGYDASVAPYPYDPEKAKALLKEAGFDGNFPPQELEVGRGRQPYNEEVSEAIAAYWNAVGVPTKVVVLESAAALQKIVSGKSGLAFFGTLNPQLDSDQMSLNLHSKQRGLYYNSPRTDELLDRGRQSFDLDARSKIYSELHQIMKDEAPMVFLYDVGQVYAARKNVEWEPPTNDRMFFWGAKVK